MAHSDGSWLGKVALVALLGLVGCREGASSGSAAAGSRAEPAAFSFGTEPPKAPGGSAAPSSSFLISFSEGVIPAAAEDLISSAGGTLAARYPAVGAVLARASSATFAATVRATAGVEAVGAIEAAHSRIELPLLHAGADRRPREPGRMPPPSSGGGDPLSFRQWDMDQIHAPEARAISSGKKTVLVGVVDSGIDVTHPDLAGQVDAAASASCVGGVPNAAPAAWASDVIGHGTHVAGTIAAAKNGVGIVGVAPGVRLAAVKVAVDDADDPSFGLVLPDAFVCAVDWAIAHDFDLINASLTIDPFTAPIDDIFCSDEPDRAAVISIVRRAVLAAARNQVTIVAASGNFFTDLASLTSQTKIEGSHPASHCRVLPVQLRPVIGVSAVGYTQALSFYSNYGAGAIDLAGPGGDSLIPDPLVNDTAASGQVLASVPAGSLYYVAAADYDGQVEDCASSASGTCATYAYLQGVSQAVPHVTGVAALVLSRTGKLAPEALLAKLSQSATALPCPPSPYDPGGWGRPATCDGPPAHNNFYGAGEIDALAAVR
jgi:subtilisin family serine protease